jgi:hypothetical protein
MVPASDIGLFAQNWLFVHSRHVVLPLSVDALLVLVVVHLTKVLPSVRGAVERVIMVKALAKLVGVVSSTRQPNRRQLLLRLADLGQPTLHAYLQPQKILYFRSH